jgi:hypothetical protein
MQWVRAGSLRSAGQGSSVAQMANGSAYWGVAIVFAGAGIVFLVAGNSIGVAFLPLGIVFIALALNDKPGADSDHGSDRPDD